MTTKIRAAAVATMDAAAIAAPTAGPALKPHRQPPREITVHMKATAGAQAQRQARRDARDRDAVLVRLKMVSPAGAALGTAYSECSTSAAEPRASRRRCTATRPTKSRDGQIVTSGVVRFSQLDGLSNPITGGSGAYRGASGHLTLGTPVRGFDSVDVLHLDG